MCYSLRCKTPTMLPAGGQSATSWLHYTTSCKTQSTAPEDGSNHELVGIINKPLLLRIVGVYIIYNYINLKIPVE